MFCPKCKTKQYDSARYCHICGTPQNERSNVGDDTMLQQHEAANNGGSEQNSAFMWIILIIMLILLLTSRLWDFG